MLLDCAGLDWTGLDWTVPDWSTFKKHITYISDICCWTPLDCAGLDFTGVKNGSGVQRGGSSGFRRTVPDWSEKMAERGVQWILSDCPGLDSSGVKNSSGVCI